MNIVIYGHPYHSLDYYFYEENSLIELFKSKPLEEALNYIDGVFALCIKEDNKETWITDFYGLYPIFYNAKEKKVCVNFNNDKTQEVNSKYLSLCEKNLDTRYHSAAYKRPYSLEILDLLHFMRHNELYYSTPWVNWQVLTPATILVIENGKCDNKKYNIDSNFEIDEPEFIFINSIEKTCQNRKSLIPLSAGYDSRAMYSVLTKYSENVSRYTYGKEKEFVDAFCHTDSVMPEFDYNYEKILNNNICVMNGMGDMYYKCHNLFIQPSFYDYDILYTGDGANEFLSRPYHNIYSFVYATGDGHHYKTQTNKIKTMPPNCQKRLIASKKIKTEEDRVLFSKSIIEKTNAGLLEIPFHTGDSLTDNRSSNFGHNFDFNSKLKYVKAYINYIKNI